MKIYAKQVNPAYQESPIFFDECFPDNIILTGKTAFSIAGTAHFTINYRKSRNIPCKSF